MPLSFSFCRFQAERRASPALSSSCFLQQSRCPQRLLAIAIMIPGRCAPHKTKRGRRRRPRWLVDQAAIAMLLTQYVASGRRPSLRYPQDTPSFGESGFNSVSTCVRRKADTPAPPKVDLMRGVACPYLSIYRSGHCFTEVYSMSACPVSSRLRQPQTSRPSAEATRPSTRRR